MRAVYWPVKTICAISRTSPFQRQSLSTIRSTNTPFTLRCQFQQFLRTQIRKESTIASPSTQSIPISPSQNQQPLTWNRFLQLRKVRRRLGLVASILCTIAALGGGISYISQNPDIEAKVSPMIGLDPLITMGIMTFACGAAGWLVGPFIGGAVFSARYRSLSRMIAEKEKEFFDRIKKYRVDPTVSSLGNPVPDYYGEKIGSVLDYRKWLKDQRAFNLKREKV